MLRSLFVLALVAAYGAPATTGAQSCALTATRISALSREESDRQAQQIVSDARRIANDFDKCRTLATAIDRTRSATTANMLFNTVASLRGDFEIAELLVAAGARGLLESRTAMTFFGAADRIENDFQLYRALSAALRSATDKQSLAPAILRSSEGIADDYQLASLLTEIAAAVPIIGDLREQYLGVAKTLQSDWEYKRATDAASRRASLR